MKRLRFLGVWAGEKQEESRVEAAGTPSYKAMS